MTKAEILSYLQTHKDELGRKYGVVKIGLFGSYARDEQNDSSDIDIAVELEKSKKSLSVLFALKREIEQSLGKSVDIGIESALKPIVKEYVQKEIIYV